MVIFMLNFVLVVGIRGIREYAFPVKKKRKKERKKKGGGRDRDKVSEQETL